MRFKSLFFSVIIGLIITGCSSSQKVALNNDETVASDEMIVQDAREGNDDLEELFWARRDSTKLKFTEADVDFMTGMIGHHSQALIMSSLAKPNNASRSVQTLAARIINAQKDEIAIMQRWLSDRNQTVPQVKIEGLNLIITPGTTPSLIFTEEAVIAGLDRSTAVEEHTMHAADKEKPEEMQDRSSNMSHMADNGAGEKGEMEHSAMGHEMAMHDHSGMPGMLSQIQLEELASTKGKDFDRLFLRYMIQHHAGAITMVNELVSIDGAAQEVSIGKLAGDINVDQKTEIERMRLMLMQILESEGSE